jgi:periplasmic divalent cation tolerance protein
MFIKTAESELTTMEATIREISGYELPELIVVNIDGGSADYLAWVAASIGENRA